MKIELLPTSSLRINPDNPRVIRDERYAKLVKSIREFPKMLEIRPIVVNSDMMVLGGNMRLRACKEAGLKKVPVIRADELTEDEQRRFIIADNISFGEHDFDILANWDAEELADWGLEIPGFTTDEGLPDAFTLADGDRAPFQQMTFTVADEQAQQIKAALAEIKETDDYKYTETFGNENGNGNALYLIVSTWAGQKTLL